MCVWSGVEWIIVSGVECDVCVCVEWGEADGK
jgi:hypothetical protein